MTWRNQTSALVVAACLAAMPVMARAADAPAASSTSTTLDEQVAQTAGRQQDLKNEVTQAAAQLDTVIAEFDANGLGDGQDVKTLKAVRAALSRLSGKQMDQVIALLQQARAASDSGQMKNTVAQAYSAQQNVLLQMRQIMITCQEQTDLIDLSVQFGLLADRQNAAFKAAKHLARQTNGNKANLNEGQIAILQVQLSDEASLRDEVKARLDKLATLVDQVDSATANQLSKVMTAIPPADLLSSLEDACVGLRQTNVYQTAVAQRKARDQLREMSRLVAPPRNVEQILTDSADMVKAQIEKQTALIADTDQHRTGWTDDARNQLDDEQGDVIDAIDEVRQDIEPIATIPHDTLGQAQQQMQNAVGRIVSNDPNGALQPENLGLAALAVAHQQLLDALKSAQQQAAAAQTKLEQAHSLQSGLQELRRQEQQAMTQAKAANTPALMKAAADKQMQVATDGQNLEPDASDGPEDLSQALADALSHMDTAQQDLSKDPAPDNALPEQQAAIDSLAQAQTKADAQVAQLQQEDEEAKKLKEASVAVGKLITRQQQVQITTAIVSARPAGKRPDDPTESPLPQPAELADKQGKLKDDTGTVAGTLPGDVADAATDLQQAQQSMGDAQTTLDKPDPPQAAAPQQQALAKLQDAKKAIDTTLAQLAQQLDPSAQQQDQQQADQQAQDLVQQAQQAVAQAQQDLNQNKNDQAANQFQQAAMLATQAANADSNLPPDAKQGLQNAQAELTQGATDAAADKNPEAQKDAEQALADLTKAGASMQMANSNLAQQNQPGQDQDLPPGDLPPTTPGTGKSKKPPKPMTIDPNGTRGTTTGDSSFAGLPTRDRDAITQSESEKLPEEYAPMIQQYKQNLAESEKK